MTPEQIETITWALMIAAVCGISSLIISVISLVVAMKAFQEAVKK